MKAIPPQNTYRTAQPAAEKPEIWETPEIDQNHPIISTLN
jgi:hypothetical protein